MSCLKLREIYDYLEKELSTEERERVENHLLSCPRCQQALRERQALLEGIKRLPRLELPEEFTSQVLAKLPELSRKKTWLVFLAGGLYLLFSLFVAFWIMASQIKTLAWSWEVFKHIFGLSWKLSRLLILGFKYLEALAKSFSLAGKIIVNSLTDFFNPNLALGLSALGVFISLALALWLLKYIKISERS
ncbi:MAG: zf-HC2 domain-containing protein [Candidatus Aminicenantes bacterium]|nr:zf-HC2 domain-containing protein [Candidatus Aminicenantes bacterium]